MLIDYDGDDLVRTDNDVPICPCTYHGKLCVECTENITNTINYLQKLENGRISQLCNQKNFTDADTEAQFFNTAIAALKCYKKALEEYNLFSKSVMTTDIAVAQILELCLRAHKYE